MVNLRVILVVVACAGFARSADKVIALNQVGAIKMLLYDSGTMDCDTLICPQHTFKCVVDQLSGTKNVHTDRTCYDDSNAVILEKSDVTPLTRSQGVNSKVSASIDKNGVVNSSQSSFQTSQPYAQVDRHESSINFREKLLRRLRKILRQIKVLRQKLFSARIMSGYLRILRHRDQ